MRRLFNLQCGEVSAIGPFANNGPRCFALSQSSERVTVNAESQIFVELAMTEFKQTRDTGRAVFKMCKTVTGSWPIEDYSFQIDAPAQTI